MMGVCCCSLAGTAACQTCLNNPASAYSPVKYVQVVRVEDLARRVDDYFTTPKEEPTKRKSHWLERRFSENVLGYECPICHTTWDFRTNYCPNCGERMEREE